MSDDKKAGQNHPPHSGNPLWRPRGRKNTKTVLRDIATEQQRLRLGGAPREASNAELLFLVLMKGALNGNLAATRALGHFRRRLSPEPEMTGGIIVFPEPLTLEEFEVHARAQQAVYEHMVKTDPLYND